MSNSTERFSDYGQQAYNIEDSEADFEDVKPKKKFAWGKWWFLSTSFVITATISATVGATVALLSPFSPMIASLDSGNISIGKESKGLGFLFPYNISRPINVLVLGIDRVPDAEESSPEVFAGRSDTMLLLRLDPEDDSIRILSIPRDTRISRSGLTVPKINQANADGGVAFAAQVVSKTLNNVPIDRYVRVTNDAFRELVDLVGGVEVFVPYPMSYQDLTQKLEINLEPGWQILDGDKAEQFARFRNGENGDIGRVQRQQMLLKALRQRLQSPSVIPQLPKAINILNQYIDTNLSLEEMLAVAKFGLELNSDNVRMVMLPGRFSQQDEFDLSYWIMSDTGRDRIMKEYFDQEPIYASWIDPSDPSEIDYRVRIAIQNATNDPKVTYQVARYLAERNFHNVYITKDYHRPLRQSEIIAQQGNLITATTLQSLMGLGKVDASSLGHVESDFTIRIGRDWLDQEFE